MAQTKLLLVPEEAAASIEARVKTIAQCKAYVRETMKRYEGLKALDAELEKRGILKAVAQIAKEG